MKEQEADPTRPDGAFQLDTFPNWQSVFSLSSSLTGLASLNILGHVQIDWARFHLPFDLKGHDELDESLLDSLIFDPDGFPEAIRPHIPQYVDAILNGPSLSGEAILYVAIHLHEKLNKALSDLMIEARHYAATTRAKARGLSTTTYNKTASKIASTETKAIVSRMKKRHRAKTETLAKSAPKAKRGPKQKWNHENVLQNVSAAVASLRKANREANRKNPKKNIPTLEYGVVASELGIDKEALRKRVKRYMETDWDTLRINWATEFSRRSIRGHRSQRT